MKGGKAGIPVPEYMGEQKEDKTLLLMLDLIEDIKDHEDVRVYLNRLFNIRGLLRETNMI